MGSAGWSCGYGSGSGLQPEKKNLRSNDKYDIEYSGSVSFSDNAIYGKSAKFKRDELSTEYLKINSNFDFHNLWDDNGISISVWVYVEDYSSLPSWARIYEFSIDDLAQDRIVLMLSLIHISEPTRRS